PAPFDSCGEDTTEDELDCEEFAACKGGDSPIVGSVSFFAGTWTNCIEEKQTAPERLFPNANFTQGVVTNSRGYVCVESAEEETETYVYLYDVCELDPAAEDPNADAYPLDPGEGTLIGPNGEAAMTRGDPDALPPSLPSVFSPGMNTDFEGTGILPGNEVTMSFSGGEDIQAFDASLRWPAAVTPIDIPSACDARFDRNEDLVVTWEPDPGYDGLMQVQIATLALQLRIPEAGIRTIETRVVISVPDSDGGATIPAEALRRFPIDHGPGTLSIQERFALFRSQTVDLSVEMTSGSEAEVQATGTWAWEFGRAYEPAPVE
ncbi:MAG: hypothetical protein AAF488_14150, partial [Planctomycetota bacterium]